MIVQSIGTDKVTTNLQGKAIGINLDSKKIFELTARSLYSNPIKSICRELLSNGIDAIVAKKALGFGEFDSRLIVRLDDNSLTNTPQYTITFKDNGIGINSKQIYEIYGTFMKSDKDTSNNFIGGFGIGSKSPLAYTDKIWIETSGFYSPYLLLRDVENRAERQRMVVENVISTYMLDYSLAEPTIYKIFDIPNLLEETGTSIRIEVKSLDDAKLFLKYCQYYAHFFSQEVEFQIHKSISISMYDGPLDLEFDNLKVTHSREHTSYVLVKTVIDQLFYTAEPSTSKVNITLDGVTKNINCPFIGYFYAPYGTESISIPSYLPKYGIILGEVLYELDPDIVEWARQEYVSSKTRKLVQRGVKDRVIANQKGLDHTKVLDVISSNKIFLFFETGTLTPTSSRERIQFTQEQIERIKAVLFDLARKSHKKIRKAEDEKSKTTHLFIREADRKTLHTLYEQLNSWKKSSIEKGTVLIAKRGIAVSVRYETVLRALDQILNLFTMRNLYGRVYEGDRNNHLHEKLLLPVVNLTPTEMSKFAETISRNLLQNDLTAKFSTFSEPKFLVPNKKGYIREADGLASDTIPVDLRYVISIDEKKTIIRRNDSGYRTLLKALFNLFLTTRPVSYEVTRATYIIQKKELQQFLKDRIKIIPTSSISLRVYDPEDCKFKTEHVTLNCNNTKRRFVVVTSSDLEVFKKSFILLGKYVSVIYLTKENEKAFGKTYRLSSEKGHFTPEEIAKIQNKLKKGELSEEYKSLEKIKVDVIYKQFPNLIPLNQYLESKYYTKILIKKESAIVKRLLNLEELLTEKKFHWTGSLFCMPKEMPIFFTAKVRKNKSFDRIAAVLGERKMARLFLAANKIKKNRNDRESLEILSPYLVKDLKFYGHC